MINKSTVAAVFKTIDKFFFGFEDSEETEKPEIKADFIEIDTEEEFDVERSSN